MALSFRKWVKGIFVQNELDRTKEVGLTVDNSASSGTSTTLVAKQTLSRTLDLPDVSGTLVEASAAQTLVNKIIDGDDNTVRDLPLTAIKTALSDASKFLARDASGVPVSVNVVPAGTVVGTTDSQTLTNKTISGASNTITNVSASNVVVTPSGNLSSTDAQAALVELQGDINTINSNAVVGPASSTDNAISRFDGTTGKLTQNSGVIISDTNNVTGVVDLTTTGNIIVGGDLTINGTTTTVNTANLNVTDKNITVNNGGSDIVSEGAGLTVDRVGTKGSLIYANASPSKFKAGDLGSEIELANISSSQSLTNKNLKSATNLLTGAKSNSFVRETGNAQTFTIPDSTIADTFVTQAFSQALTNKDIDGGAASNTSRLTVPKDTLANLLALTRKQGTVVYATDTNKLYRDDGTSLQEIGSGAGQKNFISNGDAEANTSGWATYADAAGTRPVDGTGGTANITFTRSTTAPLADTASFIFTKDAANRQGQGASYDFTIDSTYKAKVLQIEIDYLVNSGTFVAGSSTTDSDLICYLYDITNSQLIEPSNIKLFSNSTTISDKYQGTFQTSSTGTNYRLILHCSSTSALAYSIKVDNVKVSPSVYVSGTPVTDIATYLPGVTGNLTTNVTNTIKAGRIGDRLVGNIGSTFTGVNTQGPQYYFIGGVSIDFNKLPSVRAVVGKWFVRTNAGVIANGVATATSGYGANTVYLEGLISSTNTPVTIDNGTVLVTEFDIPIVGWSSSVRVSDGYEGRQIKSGAYRSSAGSVTTTPAEIIFDTKRYDTTTSYNSTNGRFVAPVASYYRAYYNLTLNASATAPNYLESYMRVNGGGDQYGYYYNTTITASKTFSPYGYAEFYMKAGDYVSVTSAVGSNSASFITGSGQDLLSFYVSRIETPQTIAQSEAVFAHYVTNASPSYGASPTVINYVTKVEDSHGAVTTGASWQFKTPRAGRYLVSAGLYYNASAATTSDIQLNFRVNGTDVLSFNNPKPGTTSVASAVSGSGYLNLKAGDIVDARAFQGLGTLSLIASVSFNFIQIASIN